jgi:hypothetical protein
MREMAWQMGIPSDFLWFVLLVFSLLALFIGFRGSRDGGGGVIKDEIFHVVDDVLCLSSSSE